MPKKISKLVRRNLIHDSRDRALSNLKAKIWNVNDQLDEIKKALDPERYGGVTYDPGGVVYYRRDLGFVERIRVRDARERKSDLLKQRDELMARLKMVKV